MEDLTGHILELYEHFDTWQNGQNNLKKCYKSDIIMTTHLTQAPEEIGKEVQFERTKISSHIVTKDSIKHVLRGMYEDPFQSDEEIKIPSII